MIHYEKYIQWWIIAVVCTLARFFIYLNIFHHVQDKKVFLKTSY